MKKIMCVVLAMLLAAFFIGCGSEGHGSPAGRLDTSFSYPAGYVFFDGPAGNTDVGVETAIQPDGKIVVAGYTNNGTKNNVLLARYTKDGQLDQGFGNNGVVIYDGGGTDHKGLGLALSPDGSIIITGYIRSATDRNILVLKFLSNGSLAKSYIYSSAGRFTDIGFGVAVQQDGKIVVVGEQSNGINQDIVLLRLDTDLVLDPTFGSGGIVTFNGGANANDKGFAVIIQNDNKIVVAGAEVPAGKTKEDVLLLRFNSNGSLDPGFGSNGVFTYSHTGDYSDYGNCLQLQADGRIVIAGAFYDGLRYETLLLRVNPDGTLDGGFGAGGVVFYQGPSQVYDYAYGVAIQADGRILVAGVSSNGSNNDAVVLRFRSNGTLDPSFAANGVFTFNASGQDDAANDIELQPDGKVVVVGDSSVNGNRNMVLFRLFQ